MSAHTENASTPSFETALKQLEDLVRAMEDGEIPLADLIAKYEEGTRLLKVCQAQLKDAELKIEILKTENDSHTLENFQPEG